VLQFGAAVCRKGGSAGVPSSFSSLKVKPGRNDRSETMLVPNPPATCPAPTQPALVLAKGNYVVKDAT
jgi:hypothetical protein